MYIFDIRCISVSRARLVRSLVKSSRPHDPYELTATSHDMVMPLAHSHTLPLRAPGEQFFGVGVVDKPHGVGHRFGSCSHTRHDVTRRHDASLWGKFITFRRGVRVTGPGPGGLSAAVRGLLRGVISEIRHQTSLGSLQKSSVWALLSRRRVRQCRIFS